MEERSLENLVARHKEDPWQIFLSLPHLSSFFLKNLKKVIAITFLFMGLAIVMAGNKNIEYSAVGTLKDSPVNSKEVFSKGGVLTYENASSSEESEDSSIIASLLSGGVLSPVIEELGLLATCEPLQLKFFKDLQMKFLTLLSNITSHYQIDWALLLGQEVIEIDRSKGALEVTHVSLAGSDPKRYRIHIIDEKSYKLLSHDGKLLKTGLFDQELKTEGLKLTVATPGHEVTAPVHKLTVAPKFLGLTRLRAGLKIGRHPDSTEIIELSYTSNNQVHSSKVINKIMDSYIRERQKEIDATAEEKLAYLEERQEEVLGAMEELIRGESSEYNFELNGGLNYERQAEQISELKKGLIEKKSATHMQLVSLSAVHKNGWSLTTNVSKELPFFKESLERLQRLKARRETLALHKPPDQSLDLQRLLIKRKEKADGKSENLSVLLASVTKSTRVKHDPLLPILSSLKRRSQLSSRVINEKIRYPVASSLELNGLTLDSAEQMYDKLSTTRSQLTQKKERMTFILSQIPKPDFPVASLSDYLTGPVSEELIQQASEFVERIANPTFYSDRELDFFQEFLKSKKDILTEYLKQNVKMIQSELTVIITQLHLLKSYIVNEINHEVVVTEQQIEDELVKKINSISIEEKEITRQLAAVTERQKQLPKLRASEQVWKMKKEITNQVTTALTEMVEAISLTQALKKVSTKPLDRAVTPLKPNRSGILVTTLFGSLWGALLSISLLFVSEAVTGFHATPTALRLAGAHVAGEIPYRTRDTAPCTKERDLLRRILRYHKKPLMINGVEPSTPFRILVLSGDGATPAPQLAETLYRHGSRVLLIETPFFSAEANETGDGLLAFLHDKVDTPIIHHRSGFDHIYSGGTCPDASDLLDSKKFRHLVKSYTDYDWIILGHSGPLEAIESHTLLNYTYRVVVQVTNEKYKTLMPYLPHDENGNKRITFIFTA